MGCESFTWKLLSRLVNAARSLFCSSIGDKEYFAGLVTP